ncbi:nucleoside deaminase [Thermocrinis sp.]
MEEKWIKECLKEAEKAFDAGEVPVGAVVVKGNRIIAKAHNRVEKLKDPTAHAEVLAIRKALKELREKYLYGCTMYVSLEPCPMCAYALILARMDRVVFLAQNEKAGGVMSLYNLLDDKSFNHRVKWEYKPMKEAQVLIERFFEGLR